MDRIEIPMEGDAARWVEAIERGDEVVITRDGEVVAEVTRRPAPSSGYRENRIDLAKLRELRAQIPWREADAGALIRQMRDEDDH